MEVLITREQIRDLVLRNIGSIVRISHLQEDIDLLQLHLEAVHADLLEELHGVLDYIGWHFADQYLVVQQRFYCLDLSY